MACLFKGRANGARESVCQSDHGTNSSVAHCVMEGTAMVLLSNEKDTDMNWDILEGKWDQFRGRAREQWGKLTEDDLDVAAGKKDQLAGKIQERYGKSREEAEREVDNWINDI